MTVKTDSLPEEIVSNRRSHEVPSTIGDHIDRMISDANEIDKQLMDGPVSLMGDAEPTLWKMIHDIKTQLEAAKLLWR